VPTDQAQALLILAFLADTLAEIDDADLAERLREVLIDWVPQVRA
jgi:Fe-S cluster assembly protein SufD